MRDVHMQRRNALAELAKTSRRSRLATLRAMPPATRFVLRGDSAARVAVEGIFGVALPTAACRAASSGERSALWLGPDEWLLIAADEGKHNLHTALSAALVSVPSSLVDISHRHAALEISGPRTAEVLNAFVPLDLDPTAFPVGMCTRTLLAKSEIVLWRLAADVFRIEVWRSVAPYVWQCLEEARREHLDV